MIKPLYDFFNWQFNKAAEYAPIMHEYPKTSASIAGFAEANAFLQTIQYLTYKMAPDFYDNNFKQIEKYAFVGTTISAVLLATLAPQELDQLKNNHPVYFKGIEGIITGTMTGLYVDINAEKPLFEKVIKKLR